jgi:hypothetical protein
VIVVESSATTDTKCLKTYMSRYLLPTFIQTFTTDPTLLIFIQIDFYHNANLNKIDFNYCSINRFLGVIQEISALYQVNAPYGMRKI